MFQLALGGCGYNKSTYVLKCQDTQQQASANNDIFMRIASQEIYKKLKQDDQLELLPIKANDQTLYQMYLSREDSFSMGVSRHAWVGTYLYSKGFRPHTNIYVTYEVKKESFSTEPERIGELVSFIVVHDDCGGVDVI